MVHRDIKPANVLLENGVDITAVHNHLLRASPATYYMHIAAHGDPVKIATAIRTALAESKTPLTAAPAGGAASRSRSEAAVFLIR